MKTTSCVFKAFLFTLLLLHVTVCRADILIDSFETPQSAPGGVDSRNVAAGNGIIGGERDFVTYLTFSANGTAPGQMRISFPESLTGRAGGDIIYDGIDNDPSSGSFLGLGTLDLTQGGLNDRFRFNITSIANSSATVLVEVAWPSHVSTLQLILPSTSGAFDLPFSAFQPFATYAPVDFHQVGYISFHFEMNSGEMVTIDSIYAVPEPSALALIVVGCGVFVLLRLKRFNEARGPIR